MLEEISSDTCTGNKGHGDTAKNRKEAKGKFIAETEQNGRLYMFQWGMKCGQVVHWCRILLLSSEIVKAY